MQRSHSTLVILILGACLAGCANRPGQTRSGFLSSYDGLQRVSDAEYARADRDALAKLTGIYLEETRLLVETTPDGTPIPEKDTAQIRDHIRISLAKSLGTEYVVADAPGPNIGRLRVAVTEVKKPATLLNLHPVSKMTGAGLGGATIESEILDSEGRQIAALVEPRKGDQFELDTLSDYDDAIDAIEAWAASLRKRLDAARGLSAPSKGIARD